ncbi:hypothetical protein HN789_06285 [archaeon]|jgi:hypothetical protein|nr:hypothetical protein [archaeon]MBT3721735.1 hypothetical protein [archaeon]MBT4022377.1 hypothetical protein [archaeon]MBT4273255.1 hypothetical protein [archaeon]MBT4461302.1 hypothetical protein [archaeon]
MGSILSSKVQEDGKITYEVVIDRDEALQLKGNLDGIHVISEKAAETKSRISLRGKNDATKYFLIPREFREDIKKSKEVTCQKIDTSAKSVYIFYVDKIKI